MRNQRTLLKFCLIGILSVVVPILAQILATTALAGSLPSPLRQDVPPTPFLYPPYYGESYVTSVFDHKYPLYGQEVHILEPDGNPCSDCNTYVVHNNGIRYGTTNAEVNVETCQSHTAYCYTGHNGIDYGVPMGEPILAAGDGSVTWANWGDNNHLDDGYGLSVVISHTNTNGYYTQYSHLSSASVDGENPVQVGETIGTSGGTGVASRCGSYRNANCYGAHLHFSVYRDGVSAGNVVNPYGWYTTTASTVLTDPWSKTSYNLWERFPSVTNTDVYTDHNDAPLTKPQPPRPNDPGVVTVDNDEVVVVDADGNIQDPPGCWTLQNDAGYSGSTLSTDALFDDDASITCKARWPLTQTEEAAGTYEVYAYVPSNHTTTNGGAIYRIHHDGQIHQAIVVQAAFPNPEPDDNWVYLGKYHFVRDGSTDEYVELGNVTLDNNLNLSFEVAADAVAFVPLETTPITPTPTVTPTVTPTITPTVILSANRFCENRRN